MVVEIQDSPGFNVLLLLVLPASPSSLSDGNSGDGDADQFVNRDSDSAQDFMGGLLIDSI